MYQYVRDGISDDYGIVALQDKILEIMVYIDDLCREYNIDYCLMGGSALGAKRHEGFIPWDDDLDIFMTPDNYEKFRETFRSVGDSALYYLQELGATDGMVTTSKLRMNGTTYIEQSLSKLQMHHGIYVDIFILHNCPNNIVLQLWQFFWAKYVITKGLTCREQNRHTGIKKILVDMAKLLPKRFLINFGLRQVYRYRNCESPYYCNFLGKALFHNGIYSKEYFDEKEYASFEKVKLKVPVKIHEFLSDRFGDYMRIPNKKEIKWEQHVDTWDVNKDFHEYLDVKTYADEENLI